MKFKNRPKKREMENVIPLINIVFLILIFFLVAGQLNSINHENINLPDIKSAGNNDEAKHQEIKPNQLLISVDGTILTSNGAIDIKDLPGHLKTISKDSGQVISIVADRDLQASKFLKIMAVINQAEIKNIELIATRSR